MYFAYRKIVNCGQKGTVVGLILQNGQISPITNALLISSPSEVGPTFLRPKSRWVCD